MKQYHTAKDAQIVIAHKAAKPCTSYRIRLNENGWYVIDKIVISQDVNCNLKVNGKRVGELINGLFREGCDDIASWSESSKQRFLERGIQFGKELEARAIVNSANAHSPAFV